MLVSNQPQSSAYNRNNVQNNNVQFKGTIDKSVTKYLNEVRKDVISTQKKKSNFDVNIVKETKNAISNIMKRLKAFMSQTNEETTLILKKTRTTETGTKLGRLMFKDTRTGAEISADTIKTPKTALFLRNQKETIKLSPEMEYKIKPENDNIFLNILGVRGKHKNIDDLKIMEEWSKNLREEVPPAVIDINLNAQAQINKETKLLNNKKALENMSESKRKAIEMKQAIKELKDIKIDN